MFCNTVMLTTAEYNRLIEERKTLREAVVNYGSHTVDCPSYLTLSEGYCCTCGYGEIVDLVSTASVLPALEEPPLNYGVQEEQPPSGSLSNPQVAKLALKAVFRDRPDYFSSASPDAVLPGGPKICTEVGLNADRVPGAGRRTIPSVVGRALEECVELCLAAGVDTGAIYSHVTDSLYNQYVKHSKAQGRLIYPSTLVSPNPALYLNNIAEESADVIIRLMDVAHVANVDIPAAYERKLHEFEYKVDSGAFYTDDRGNLYVHKPHLDVEKENSDDQA